MVSPFLPDAEKVAAIREAMPATTAGIYLNAGTAGPMSRETVAAMREMEDWELRVGRADMEGYPPSPSAWTSAVVSWRRCSRPTRPASA